MYTDYHLHSHFSCDSKNNLNQICQYALQQGLSEIAITDHVDYSYPEPKPNHAIGDLEQYIEVLQYFQERYRGELTIRIGVEIGMNPRCFEAAERLVRSYPFDFVIGSVHEANGLAVSRRPFFEGKTKIDAYVAYYEAILDNIRQFQEFDVLGHLDYCKRYCPEPYEIGDQLLAQELINEILQSLINQGKGIEINTSGFRHKSQICMPHPDIIAQYHKLGGRRITIGSDAHHPQYIGLKVKETQEILKNTGFTHISTFNQRKEILLPLSANNS